MFSMNDIKIPVWHRILTVAVLVTTIALAISLHLPPVSVAQIIALLVMLSVIFQFPRISRQAMRHKFRVAHIIGFLSIVLFCLYLRQNYYSFEAMMDAGGLRSGVILGTIALTAIVTAVSILVDLTFRK